MLVAIHQPNYMPWLGYFYKMAKSDIFIFHDDVQFSKNSYINRVQVLRPGGPKWLTVPISYRFGDPINRVYPARSDWQSRHLNALLNYYRSAGCFGDVWPRIRELYHSVPDADLASINRHLVVGIAAELGISCQFTDSSQFALESLTSTDKLVALVDAVDQKGTYLSGRGGAGYQDAAKFEAAGLELRYADFRHPQYGQGDGTFNEGMSILDAIFHIGWANTAELAFARGLE